MNVREWALPVYTILMQMAVGALFVLWVIRWLAASKFEPSEIDRIIRNPILVIVFTAAAAMVAAHFHLSRPFQSFLAILNFRTSWLSREIVFTGLFFWLLLGLLYLNYFGDKRRKLITALGWLAILAGGALIYCMASIYNLPTQVAWNSPMVIMYFYMTTFLLGAMAIACLLLLDLKFAEIQKADDVNIRVQVAKNNMTGLVVFIFLAMVGTILVTYYQFDTLGRGSSIAQTSLRLLWELYTPLFGLQLICIIVAPLWMGYAVYRMHKDGAAPQELLIPIYLSSLLILIGEIIERFLFYAMHIRIGV